MNKTIVCLAAKRSGTTAVQRAFAAHPDVCICCSDQDASVYEPNFWNLAASVLAAQTRGLAKADLLDVWNQFTDKLAMTAPGLKAISPLDEQQVFSLWNAVAERYAPVVFDKSPQYLGSPAGLELLRRYRDAGNDVRFFALVRDPRDCIASQYTLWKDVYAPGTPGDRDRRWVNGYRNLEEFRQAIGAEQCPVIRYEDFSRDPDRWIGALFSHCGLAAHPLAYAHIRPVSVGRFHENAPPEIAAWTPSDALKEAGRTYGYDLDAPVGDSSGQPGTSRNRDNRKKEKSRARRRFLTHLVVTVIRKMAGRFPALWLEELVFHALEARVSKLPPHAALKTLLRLDNRLYLIQGRHAVAYGAGVHTKHRHTRYHDFFIRHIEDGDRVLDVGCGSGALAHDIVQWSSASVVGIDLNSDSIEHACKQFPHRRVDFMVGDATAGVPKGPFDVVVLSNSLEHLADRERFLSRLLESTGASRFLIRVPLFERDWRVPLKRELGIEWRLDATHETEFTLDSFAREMAGAGLAIVHQEVRWGEIWAELRPLGEK